MVNNAQSILHSAKRTLETEGTAVLNLVNHLDDNFVHAVQHIIAAQGRVIVSGIGKSAIVATKIAATLNSTGTPAIFMHAADAIHGDLGIVQENDIVLCLSQSGNSPEIKALLPLIKIRKNTLIGITGNRNSALAQQSDFVLTTTVEKEACPHNLAPTTSTSAQMALGDAIAISLLELRGFSRSDYAKHHPGGALGKKLYLRVGDIVVKNPKPQVDVTASIKDVIVEISEKMLGITAVMENDTLVGIITDGDIRRMLSRYDAIGELCAKDVMTATPITVPHTALAVKALEILQENSIEKILVLKDNRYIGAIRTHDLINEGIL